MKKKKKSIRVFEFLFSQMVRSIDLSLKVPPVGRDIPSKAHIARFTIPIQYFLYQFQGNKDFPYKSDKI